jgi:CRP/FNR family transcriptional regulator, nitrogen oxide reductase regulator
MPSEGWPRQLKNSQMQPSAAGGEKIAHEDHAQYRRFSMFRDLAPHSISDIVKLSNKKSFSRLQQVLVGAECCQQVALLTSGIVKVVQCNDAGKPTILKLAGPGELVGTIGLSVSQTCMCSCAFGLTPFTALIWNKKVFDSLLEQHPALGRNITNLLVRELNAMEDRFCELSLDQAATRLSRQMIRILNQMGNPTDEGVDICISRMEIAQLIGANFYTVSRLLADWTRKGILQRRRDVLTVRNLQALIELSRNAIRSAV